ncbi:hypothetical protein D3C73_905870 [compost metagenome]
MFHAVSEVINTGIHISRHTRLFFALQAERIPAEQGGMRTHGIFHIGFGSVALRDRLTFVRCVLLPEKRACAPDIVKIDEQ